MNENIRKHIEGLFAEAPKTRKAVELKEEIIQNTTEKYQDLISEGYIEGDALNIVLDSIGDVTELFKALEESNPLTLSETDRKKKATLKAAAAGLYIFAGVVFVICMLLNDMYFYMHSGFETLSIAITALVCIPPTCMLVYAAHMYPDFHKKEDTLVESYKENAHIRNKEKAVHSSVSAIIWLLTVTIYFIISFATFYWHVTWIIFLVGGCAQAVAALIFSLRRDS